jgi:hypothetical protein
MVNTRIVLAFTSKTLSLIILFLLCRGKLHIPGNINILELAVSVTIATYALASFSLLTGRSYSSNTRGIFVVQKESGKPGLFATGCLPLGVILIKGNILSLFTDEEKEAAIQHEMYHIKYCNVLIRFFLVFLLKDILPAAGLPGYLLLYAIFFQTGYLFECLADRYAAQKVSAGAIIRAVEKLTGKNERFFEILEYIPFVNVFFVSHPCFAFRKGMLSSYPGLVTPADVTHV